MLQDAMASFFQRVSTNPRDPELAKIIEETFEHSFNPDPDDPRLQDEPPASEHLQATFKWEHQTEDGEDIGPLIVYDQDANRVVWETSEWVRVSEAQALASSKGWQFSIDGSSDCF
jgi:hypothetical protein